MAALPLVVENKLWVRKEPLFYGAVTWSLELEDVKQNAAAELTFGDEKVRVAALTFTDSWIKLTITVIPKERKKIMLLTSFAKPWGSGTCSTEDVSSGLELVKYYYSHRYEGTINLSMASLERVECLDRLTLMEPTSFPDMWLKFDCDDKDDEEAKRLPCHKSILAFVSEFFKQHLSSSTWPTVESTIMIDRLSDDFKADMQTLGCFLLLIYHGDEIDWDRDEKLEKNNHCQAYEKLTSSQRCQLLLLADKYFVPRVSMWLARRMEENFEHINLCELLQTTDLIADSNIKEYIKHCISLEILKNTKKLMDDQLKFFAQNRLPTKTCLLKKKE